MAATSRATPDLDATADRLHSVAIRLLRSVRVEDEESGLSPARLSALSVVVFAGPLRLGELAETEQVRPPTMSTIVRALEAEGLVERSADPADRRGVLIAATPRGRRLLQTARSRRLKRLRRELADLPPDQLRLVGAAAEVLSRRFLPERSP